MNALAESNFDQKLMLIVNPVAGRKQSLRLVPEIVRIFMDAGYLVTVMVTKAQGDATAFAEHFGKEYDAVVCVGGDGTLSETAAAPKAWIPKRPLRIMQGAST